MIKLHEPIPGETSEENEQKTKGSDRLRKKIEDLGININKPLDQLSETERYSLLHLLNNFYMKVPGGAKTSENPHMKKLKPGYFDLPMREKFDPKELDGRMSGPLEWKFSEKYLNESQRQLQENIKQALINRGVDMEELERKIKSEDKDLVDWINLNSLPAIFDLLDGGYNIYDLTI